VQSELFAVKIFEHFMRFESSRCCIDFDLTTFLLRKRKIKSKVKNRRDSLNDFTHVHVHIYRHTRTRLPASHIFAFMSRSVCTQNRGLLSHKYFVLSFASSPQVFKNSRLQTRFCYYILSLRTKVAESVLRRGSRNASGGIYWDACHLSWVLFYRLAFYGIFDILQRHVYIPTCHKLIWQK